MLQRLPRRRRPIESLRNFLRAIYPAQLHPLCNQFIATRGQVVATTRPSALGFAIADESAGVRVGHPDRQCELERRSLRVAAQSREAATVRLDDRPTDRQTHAHALDLGREE